MGGAALEQRVERVAEAALAEQRYVSAIDLLLGLGWPAPLHLDEWRQGRVHAARAWIIWSSCLREMSGLLAVLTEPASCPRSSSGSAAVASATSAKGCSSRTPRSPGAAGSPEDH